MKRGNNSTEPEKKYRGSRVMIWGTVMLALLLALCVVGNVAAKYKFETTFSYDVDIYTRALYLDLSGETQTINRTIYLQGLDENATTLINTNNNNQTTGLSYDFNVLNYTGGNVIQNDITYTVGYEVTKYSEYYNRSNVTLEQKNGNDKILNGGTAESHSYTITFGSGYVHNTEVKVTIKYNTNNTDKTINLIFVLQCFGTNKEYTATKTNANIVADGVMDDAYKYADPIDISTVVNGSTPVTAKAYILWDENFYYLFIDVKDPTLKEYNSDGADMPYSSAINVDNSKNTEVHCDAVEIRMDLLHSNDMKPSYMSKGYTGAPWGEYRGGLMCEAGFIIGAGYTPSGNERFSNDTAEDKMELNIQFGGSRAGYEWWSNYLRHYDNQGSKGVSKITADGYTVEYKLNANVAQYGTITKPMGSYTPHAGQLIGFGVRIFDNDTANRVVIERINDGMNTDARKLSTVRLIEK